MQRTIEQSNELRKIFKLEESLRKRFEEPLKAIIRDKLCEQHLLSVDARTKTEHSFIAKVYRLDKSYSDPVSEVTDITGIRIVVEYKDEAEKVEAILRSHLNIDDINSRNTRNEAPESEFGYSAIHIVASITESIAEQYDCQAILDRKFEIQIRTNLENAWATKSRELFYEKAVPMEYKRELNRLAALLEIADESFLNLRNKVIPSAQNTSAPTTAQTKISASDVVDILKSDKSLAEVVDALAFDGLKVSESTRNDFAMEIANILFRQGATTKEEGEAILAANIENIVAASKFYMQAANLQTFRKDSLLVATLAIIDNGNITPEAYCNTWGGRWKNGFLKAFDEFKTWQEHRQARTIAQPEHGREDAVGRRKDDAPVVETADLEG